MEVCDAVITKEGYYRYCSTTDVITGITRKFVEIDGRAEIMGYMPKWNGIRNGIWYFPN
jgi:hypothetical protein